MKKLDAMLANNRRLALWAFVAFSFALFLYTCGNYKPKSVVTAPPQYPPMSPSAEKRCLERGYNTLPEENAELLSVKCLPDWDCFIYYQGENSRRPPAMHYIFIGPKGFGNSKRQWDEGGVCWGGKELLLR